MKIENLSKKDKEITKDFLKYYKHVSSCSNCKQLFGHDKTKEELCLGCDPKTVDRIKERFTDDI